jgi:hypothetical protein
MFLYLQPLFFQKIHAPEQEEEAEHIAKPFEPKKKGAKPSMSFLNKREEHRGRLEKLSGEFGKDNYL